LNELAEESALQTESGRAVRFVAPATDDAYYEVRLFETGRVETRPDNLHDLFNALAWLAFPRTKARINAMHAAQIPREQGRRGRLRDLLTIFDEGGAIVCAPPQLVELVRGFRWKELFWERRDETLRSMKVHILGHAVLEQALQPWPGITCKAIFAETGTDAGDDADASRHGAAAHLRLPGLAGGQRARAVLRGPTVFSPLQARPAAVKSRRESARQPLCGSHCMEESPGSAEQDAG
jgi:hypothetical protein